MSLKMSQSLRQFSGQVVERTSLNFESINSGTQNRHFSHVKET